MNIQPVSNEQMSMMNISLNSMALELQQRRAVMSQQEAQIKELERKVTEAEGGLVDLEGRLDKFKKAVKIKQSHSPQSEVYIDPETGERFLQKEGLILARGDDVDQKIATNVKPADPGEELNEMDRISFRDDPERESMAEFLSHNPSAKITVTKILEEDGPPSADNSGNGSIIIPAPFPGEKITEEVFNEENNAGDQT